MSALSRVNAWVPLGGRLGCGLQGRTWFRANSLAFRRSRRGFARIPMRFDAPAVVSRKFFCVSTLPLWFRANSHAFRRSRRGFAPIPLRLDAPAVLFWPALASSGGPLRLRATTAHAVGRDLRLLPLWFHSRRGFARIPLRFEAPAWRHANKTAEMPATRFIDA